MIKFDGMLLWKQYMPKKHGRWGIKIWCLCDSLKGYSLAFNVLTGKEGCVADDLGLGQSSGHQTFLAKDHDLWRGDRSTY